MGAPIPGGAPIPMGAPSPVPMGAPILSGAPAPLPMAAQMSSINETQSVDCDDEKENDAEPESLQLKFAKHKMTVSNREFALRGCQLKYPLKRIRDLPIRAFLRGAVFFDQTKQPDSGDALRLSNYLQSRSTTRNCSRSIPTVCSSNSVLSCYRCRNNITRICIRSKKRKAECMICILQITQRRRMNCAWSAWTSALRW